MKKLLLFFLNVFIITTICADNYKVLYVNSPSVKIDNKKCVKGMIFSDVSQVMWPHKGMQAIKALNMESKVIELFVSIKKEQQKGSVMDYYIRNNHLSTRGDMQLGNLNDLAKILNDKFYLINDTIEIDPPINLKDGRFFYVTFEQNGIIKSKELPHEGRTLFITRSLLECNKKTSAEINVKVFFSSEIEKDYLLTDSMRIYVFPLLVK